MPEDRGSDPEDLTVFLVLDLKEVWKKCSLTENSSVMC